jgi:hypothetical protein
VVKRGSRGDASDLHGPRLAPRPFSIAARPTQGASRARPRRAPHPAPIGFTCRLPVERLSPGPLHAMAAKATGAKAGAASKARKGGGGGAAAAPSAPAAADDAPGPSGQPAPRPALGPATGHDGLHPSRPVRIYADGASVRCWRFPPARAPPPAAAARRESRPAALYNLPYKSSYLTPTNPYHPPNHLSLTPQTTTKPQQASSTSSTLATRARSSRPSASTRTRR